LLLKNSDAAASWENQYTKALANINVEDLQKIADRSTTREEA